MQGSGGGGGKVGSAPTSLQSIHFPRSERTCQLEGKAQQVLPDAMCCGEFDTAGDLCVAVASVEGLLSLFKVAVGSRVWTEVNGLGCVAALLPVRGATATGRDLLLVTTAGERFLTLLDFRGGSVWRSRIENVNEACASDCRGCGEGRVQVVLGSATGAVALYEICFDSNKSAASTTCQLLQLWKVDEEATIDAVSFAKDKIVVSSSSGGIWMLGSGGAAECVARSGGQSGVAGSTKSLKQGVLVTVAMDGSVQLRDEANETLFRFSLPDSIVFSFKTSNLLRIGDEHAAAACSWSGDTWFVDGLGNVLLFQPLEDEHAATTVVAFDVYKSKHTGDAAIAYLLSTGQIIFFAVDLTCLECRLFSHHAHSFVQQHPFFAPLNAKQRSLLIEWTMNNSSF